MQADKPTIRSLTGLRFVAAFFVLVAHLAPKAMPFPNPPMWYTQFTSLAAEGMTMFFVLSGFVMYYNYSESIGRDGLKAAYNFWVARFARIYPMYAIILAYQFIVDYAYAALSSAYSQALPYYLLLIQTWFYVPLGRYGLIYDVGMLPPITWSVSTECFFYLVFPLLCLVVLRMASVRSRVTLAAVCAVIICTAVTFLSLHQTALNQWAMEHLGKVGDPSTQSQYSFFRWLVYFSPYSRVFEFILGCITASLYLNIARKPVSDGERRTGHAILTATLVSCALLHFVMFSNPNAAGLLRVITDFHMSFGFGPMMAVLIFFFARYESFIKRFLECWPMVLAGEATYSMYLWHMFVAMAVRWEAAPVTSFMIGVADLLRLAVAITMCVGFGLISWQFIEVPTRRWLRSKLSIKMQPAPALALASKAASAEDRPLAINKR